jgi:hypothetical protein
MFSVHCEGHGTEVLLTTDAITAVVHDGAGIVIHWQCACGPVRGPFRTGRARTATDPVLAA